MKPEAYVVLLFKLIGGIEAIQSPAMPVPPQRAALYARAAAFYGQKTSVDPFDLLAIARNESDFNDRAIGPDGLDCGLTQTRVTYSRYSCDQLRGSPWLAFAEAARELSAYSSSCAGKEDYDRCRFNRYNSGTRYARKGWPGRYYLRVSCFAEAARRQLPLAAQCRGVKSEEDLALLIARAEAERDRHRIDLAPEAVAESPPQPLDTEITPWVAPPLDGLTERSLRGEEPLWLASRRRVRPASRRARRRPGALPG